MSQVINPSLKILNGKVNFPFCLAPMVGLTHRPFREVVREYMPAGHHTIWPTEMLNSRRLPAQKVGDTPETLVTRDEFGNNLEDGLVPQILGNEEEHIAGSVKKLKEWGAVGIDINMGCPVQKALRHNYGVSLMGDYDYAKEIVAMTTRNTNLPVSVKLRAGLQKDADYLLKFTEGLVESGASWLTLHPRLAAEKRKGTADWTQIKFLVDRLNVPIIGNGDIQIADDAMRMLSETNCEAVMIGRALTARPWMLWQLGERLGLPAPLGKEGLKAPKDGHEEAREYGRATIKMLHKCRESFTDSLALRRFRFYLKVSHMWLNFGNALISISHKSDDFNEINDKLEIFFENDSLSLDDRTNLRY
jgi:tRNA-dihydrouridine synthase B